jgi:2-oxoglutarate ferredoxin oxidoreductase subunit beta
MDAVQMALALGGTFVARGFSGDKEQLVPLIKAGLRHRGFALIDVLSPCVTFNDHEGSTKSYAYTRRHRRSAIEADFVPPRKTIEASYGEGEVVPVEMHDGSRVLLRKVGPDYDPRNRGAALDYIRTRHRAGEIVTGLLYIGEDEPDLHGINQTAKVPLNELPYESLCPGSGALAGLQRRFK